MTSQDRNDSRGPAERFAEPPPSTETSEFRAIRKELSGLREEMKHTGDGRFGAVFWGTTLAIVIGVPVALFVMRIFEVTLLGLATATG